jgi:hypothetical protein
MSLRPLPPFWSSERLQEWMRMVADAVRALGDGRSNAVGNVTLSTSSASTVLSDPRIGKDSTIALMPRTANAAAEFGNGTLYVGTVSDGSATITHANNAQSDRSFRYAIQG